MINKNIGPLMIDVDGYELSSEDREILEHPSIGGVIIFAKNFHDIEQIKNLNRQIKTLKSKNNSNNNQLLIAIDQEGGSVQRIKEPLSIIPPMAELGKYYDYDTESALALGQQLGWLMASELLSLGFDFSFTPVVDLNLCDNKIIKSRAFHKKTRAVTDLALALIRGLGQAGMVAVAKHFPGHGGVFEDSHETTPIDNRHYDELDKYDLIPFKELINHDLESIMTSHIMFPNIDKNIVSFSNFWLQDILRDKLNFNGLIISDDLNMNGADFIINSNNGDRIALSHPQRVLTALKSGCELILLCNNRQAVVDTINDWQTFDWQSTSNYSKKIDLMRSKNDVTHSLTDLQEDVNWRSVSEKLEKLTISA